MAVYADSGADGSPLSDEEMEFFARGSDAILESNMNDSVGFSGPIARWLHRLDGGIRTFGSWERRRVIPVGRIPAILFLFFDLCVSYWFGARVIARIRANGEQDEQDDVSKGDWPDLKNESGDHEAATG